MKEIFKNKDDNIHKRSSLILKENQYMENIKFKLRKESRMKIKRMKKKNNEDFQQL